MTFKRALWLPIAVVASVLNVAAAGFALGEPVHASIHGALALAFGLWARRLQRVPVTPVVEQRDRRIDVLEDEVTDLQRQLSETRQGLQFTEKLLTQRPAAREVEMQPRTEPSRPADNDRRERGEGSDA